MSRTLRWPPNVVGTNRPVSVATYSTLFWQGELPTAVTTVFTVPALQLAVLRDVEWLNATNATQQPQVQTTVPGFGVAVVARVNSLGINLGAQWQGRVVLPAGSSLQVNGPAPGLFAVLSGYLFQA